MIKKKYIIESEEILPFSSSFRIKNDIHNIKFTFSNREYKLYIDNLYNSKNILKNVQNEIYEEFINIKVYLTNI